MIIRLIFTWLFSIADFIITLYWTNKFGLDIETSPIGRWLLECPSRAAFVKIIFTALMLLVMYIFKQYKVAQAGSWIVFGAYTVLMVYHIIILLEVFL